MAGIVGEVPPPVQLLPTPGTARNPERDVFHGWHELVHQAGTIMRIRLNRATYYRANFKKGVQVPPPVRLPAPRDPVTGRLWQTPTAP